MSRIRRYIEANVLDEARRRIDHVMDTFDDWIVAFSGGKDSLATLHLVRQVQEARGDKRKVKALFRDEEVIPDGVVQFVTALRTSEADWLDLEWWAAPARASHFILGETFDHVAFDPNREWVRQPPEFALSGDDLGLLPGQVIGQKSMDDLTVRNMKGRAAIFTGVRAAESIIRYRSCVNKLHENYIVASSSKRAHLVRPIFDWQEDDVFRFFYDYDIDYCPVYDAQAWAREKLRVSTPMHAESAKRLAALAQHAPELYEGVMRVFPEMAVQARYWDDLDRSTTLNDNADSWEAIHSWVKNNITDEAAQRRALKELASVQLRAMKQPESYPLPHVLKELMRAGGKRVIQPMRPDDAERLVKRHEKERAARG